MNEVVSNNFIGFVFLLKAKFSQNYPLFQQQPCYLQFTFAIDEKIPAIFAYSDPHDRSCATELHTRS